MHLSSVLLGPSTATESLTLRLQSDQPLGGFPFPPAISTAGLQVADRPNTSFVSFSGQRAARRDRCGHLVVAARTGPKSRLWAICVVVKAPRTLGAPAPAASRVWVLSAGSTLFVDDFLILRRSADKSPLSETCRTVWTTSLAKSDRSTEET